MFQFLFKYPSPVFTKGRFVLLGAWPEWLLPVLILAAMAGLAFLIAFRLREVSTRFQRFYSYRTSEPPKLSGFFIKKKPPWNSRESGPVNCGTALKSWRAWVIWGIQSALIALLLLLLWEPAMSVSELNSQQNIVAVVVDDSRSMALVDSNGKTREAAALSVLQGGLLAGLKKRFQVRIYQLGGGVKRVDNLKEIAPIDTATHIGEGLKQLVTSTSDLPVGAILLLSDGSQNSAELAGSGIGADALQAIENRRLPVHTIGFGKEEPAHDVELEDVSVVASAVASARIAAIVSLTQHGYTGQKATLTVRDGNTLLAARQITLGAEGQIQSEPLFIPVGNAGAKDLTFAIEPLAGEENVANNAVNRPVLVSDAKRRILYMEGEPRWEYKFIRRAEDDDPTVQFVSMLRTSENKIYRQGISDPSELAEGFPARPEDLFGYSGIVIGSVAADYFSPLQQELLREYVDRRGGGILFLGGRRSLSDGGWGASSLNDLLPTFLPRGNHNFHRDPATVELTPQGVDSPITRILDDPEKNADRWRELTYLADYEDPGDPKPGATVLAEMHAGRRTMPLLITQNYGHGRTAILATGGTWRWQMSEPLGDPSHDLFWQQLLRWLIAATPGPVTASMPNRLLMDQGLVKLTAQVRDPQFQPDAEAHVTAHIVGPQGIDALVDMEPSQDQPGEYEAEWTAEKPGPYLAEVTAETTGANPQQLGRGVLTFQREDGIAENFHTGQNRRLLQQLSSETGGQYWTPSNVKNLPRDISYSEAGISVRSTRELWNMPVVFLLLLGLPGSEWLLRRKWGVV